MQEPVVHLDHLPVRMLGPHGPARGDLIDRRERSHGVTDARQRALAGGLLGIEAVVFLRARRVETGDIVEPPPQARAACALRRRVWARWSAGIRGHSRLTRTPDLSRGDGRRSNAGRRGQRRIGAAELTCTGAPEARAWASSAAQLAS